MSSLDNLIGCKISLITNLDVRYDGILYSINTKESTIVLRNVHCLGTEDRVTDPSLVVAANNALLTFVTFPGHDIKDLYVHETGEAGAEASAPVVPAAAGGSAHAASTMPPKPPANDKTHNNDKNRSTNQGAQSSTQPNASRQPRNNHAPNVNGRTGGRGGRGSHSNDAQKSENATPNTAVVGSGEHLLHRKSKAAASSTNTSSATTKESVKVDFDFAAGLSSFDKPTVLAAVANDATHSEVKDVAKYAKDDFFDSLSCDVLDREQGRSTRLTAREERVINQDTFGAVAVQSSHYRRNYRGGGGGSGGGRYGNYSGGRGGRGRGRGGQPRPAQASA